MNRDLENETMGLLAENKKLKNELGNLNSRVMNLRKNLERETLYWFYYLKQYKVWTKIFTLLLWPLRV